MSTHSSTLALKIPWTEELGAGYYPWGRKESGTTFSSSHFSSSLAVRSSFGSDNDRFVCFDAPELGVCVCMYI